MDQLKCCACLVAALAVGCSEPVKARLAFVREGFEHPESVLHDSVRQSWFVSNTAGTQDGDGFISKLSVSGEFTERVFAAGLNDPKGQRIAGDKLYVADVTQLVAIDLEDPAQVEKVSIAGSAFLNDVAIDERDGSVYVSDTFTNTIYRVVNGRATVVLQTPALEAPNGLLFEHGGLLIASVGPDLDPATFKTSAPGRVQFLALDTLTLTPVSERIGALDGIERDDHGLVVSDFFVGVYRVGLDGKATKLVDDVTVGLGSSADIGFDPAQHRLAVPDLNGTAVAFFDLVREPGFGTP